MRPDLRDRLVLASPDPPGRRGLPGLSEVRPVPQERKESRGLLASPAQPGRKGQPVLVSLALPVLRDRRVSTELRDRKEPQASTE